MKFLIVLAVVACASATPGGLIAPRSFGYSTVAAHPYGAYHHLAAPALSYAAAPALTYAAAPAVHYAAAPAVVAPAFHKTQYHSQDELGQASHGYAYPGQAHAVVRDAAGNERGSYAYVNPEGQEIRVDYTAGHGGFQVASNALPVAPVHVAAPLAAPLPVADTPEVHAAKVAHAAAHAEARARAHLLRKKRGIVAPAIATYAAHTPAATHLTGFAAPLATYAAAPFVHHAAPAVHYAAAPALAAPVAYAAAPAVHYAAAPALAAPVAYAAPAAAVRVAELTRIVNNPGHAVSYRVD